MLAAQVKAELVAHHLPFLLPHLHIIAGALAAARTANSELEGSLGTARAELAELGAAHVGLERAKAELEAALAAEREAGVAAEARIAQAREETAECQATLLAAQENLAQAGAEAEARQRQLAAEVEGGSRVGDDEKGCGGGAWVSTPLSFHASPRMGLGRKSQALPLTASRRCQGRGGGGAGELGRGDGSAVGPDR